MQSKPIYLLRLDTLQNVDIYVKPLNDDSEFMLELFYELCLQKRFANLIDL